MPLKRKPVAEGGPQTGQSLKPPSKNDGSRIPRTRTKIQVHERRVSDHRMRQARAIHMLGPVPLACLLQSLVQGDDPEEFIQAFADSGEDLIRLAMVPPGGSA
jgi:hypothetical protein